MVKLICYDEFKLPIILPLFPLIFIERSTSTALEKNYTRITSLHVKRF